MAEFLTTADMSAEVERVVKRAQHRVVIVSPFLRTRDRIRSLIKERAERGVEVHIVYGKEELHERERGWIDALPSVQLYFHKDLHAKCYMSESAAVLGSRVSPTVARQTAVMREDGSRVVNPARGRGVLRDETQHSRRL